MKKAIAIVVWLMLCVFSVYVAAESAGEYQCSDWARVEVEKARLGKLATEDILTNCKDSITRYEFCDLIMNVYVALEQQISDKYENPFKDTDARDVVLAYNLGIVKGVSADEFAPLEHITREQMAVMMGRLAKLVSEIDTKIDLQSFDDYEKISDWAKDDLSLIAGMGIIKGTENNKIEPDENTSREQAIVMAWRLYEYLGGKDILLMEETTVNILSELGIIDVDQADSRESLTVHEALIALDKARGCYTEEIGDLSEWYRGDTLAESDYLSDAQKAFLLRLCYEGRNRILGYEEIANIKLDSNITNYEALLYTLRMIGDTYGCAGDIVIELDTDKTNIYKLAYKKGLISSENTDRAEQPITYKEFCSILHKAIFTEYDSGGYIGVITRRLIDSLTASKTDTESTKAGREIKERIRIPVEIQLNDDLSAEWTLPDEYSFITENWFSTQIGVVTKDEKVISRRIEPCVTKLDGAKIIKMIAREETQDLRAVHCTYSKSDHDKEYYVEIDISNVKWVIEGEEIKPGKYIKSGKFWYAKELTLADSDFEAGCYYILKDYENTYRSDKYNGVEFECFKAEKTSKTFIAPTNRSFGVSYLDEIHIQKVSVKGDAQSGFVLSVTPESTDVFEVVETAE